MTSLSGTTLKPPVFSLRRYFVKHGEKERCVRYNLACSDPDPFTLRQVIDMADDECTSLWQNLSLGYTESQGHPLLLQEIAGLYEGMTCKDITCMAPQEGIYAAMKVMTDLCTRRTRAGKKPHAVVVFPAYQSLYEDLKSFGVDVSFWEIESTRDGKQWKFDLRTLRSLLRDDTGILVVNFPHNPTGYQPSTRDWYEIIHICHERNLYLFSDEMYHLTNHAGVRELNPAACSLYENAISLFGLSKTFGLPGSRIGWLCTRNAAVKVGVDQFKDYLSICTSAPSEILGIITLRNKDKIISSRMRVIPHNLKLLDEFFLCEFPHLFDWRKPNACTTALVKLKGSLMNICEGGATGFCRVLLEETGILLLPSATYNYMDSYVRIGFGRSNLPDILPILRDFIRQYDTNCLAN